MLILAFDTATPAITVAVHDGNEVLSRAGGEGAMAHGEWLMPLVQSALRDAGAAVGELTDIAVGVGPGPYTGLRVGVVTALTLGSTLRIPTHGRCSLDIIAADVDDDRPEFIVATDARRKEVYWARYGAAGQRISGPDVAKPADLAALHHDINFYGRGAQLYDGILGAAGGPVDPDAGTLAQLIAADSGAALPLEPLYLRHPDAVAQTSVKRA